MAATLEEVATLLQQFNSREAKLREEEQSKTLCGIGTTLYNMLDLVKEGEQKLREEGRDASDTIGYRLRYEIRRLCEQVDKL